MQATNDAKRVITVVSTRGGAMKKFEQSLTTLGVTVRDRENQTNFEHNSLIDTWGNLKRVLETEGYDLSNLVAVERNSKVTFQEDGATLPNGDFTIFLRPSKSKFGMSEYHPSEKSSEVDSMSFMDLREEFIVSNNYEGIKEYLNYFVEDKNWTQLSLVELREGIKSFLDDSSHCVEVDTDPLLSLFLRVVFPATIVGVKDALEASDFEYVVLDEAFSRLEIIEEELESIKNVLDIKESKNNDVSKEESEWDKEERDLLKESQNFL